MPSVEGRREREQIAAGKRKGLVIGLTRISKMGCMMPSVEGVQENRSVESHVLHYI